jgi:hypothetical protein
MKNKHLEPNYGLLLLSRQSICHLHFAWQHVESPPAAMRPTPHLDEMLIFPAQRGTNDRDAA